jgi:hypothetical protein
VALIQHNPFDQLLKSDNEEHGMEAQHVHFDPTSQFIGEILPTIKYFVVTDLS